jgi:hypothetical protein
MIRELSRVKWDEYRVNEGGKEGEYMIKDGERNEMKEC